MNDKVPTEGEERVSTGIPGLDNVLCGGLTLNGCPWLRESLAPERRRLRCNFCFAPRSAQ
jgi:hypothetical protein